MKYPSSTSTNGQLIGNHVTTGESSDLCEFSGRKEARQLLELDRRGRFSLQAYVEPILRRKWLMLGALIVPVVCAVAYLKNASPSFTSVAMIEIEAKTAGHAEQLYGGARYGAYRDYFLTQLEILKARNLGEAVIGKLSPAERAEIGQARTGVLSKIKSLPNYLWSLVFTPSPVQTQVSHPALQLTSLVSGLLSRVRVRQVKTTSLICVEMSASSPDAARDLLQTYVSVYLESALENKRRESMEATVWLKGELDKTQQKAAQSHAVLAGFLVDNGIVAGPDGGLGLVTEMIHKTIDSRLKAQEGWLRIRALKETDTSADSYALPALVNSPYIGRLKEQLATLEGEYAHQQSVYSSNFPIMRALSRKIEFLKDRISNIENRIVKSAAETAQKEEDLFKESFNQMKGEADRIKALQAQYAFYKREAETDQEFLRILLKEYKAQEIKSRTTVSDIRLVDPPSMPAGPSWPVPKKIMLSAFGLGLIFALATAFIAEKLDQSVYYPTEILTDFHLRRLGVIPDGAPVGKTFWKPRSAVEVAEFLPRNDPQSPMANAVRSLQVSLMVSSSACTPKCLVISSANPKQGKTFISASLGAALASKREKTVVVDGDLRRPRLHEVFGLSTPNIGLADFLVSNEIEIGDVLRYSTIPGLSYVTSGSKAADPVDLLKSDRLAEFVEQLRTEFDHVIFDCPPVLGFADVFMLALLADGLILVVRQGGVSREDFREAVRAFSTAQVCPLLGVVMNRTNFPSVFGYRFGDHYLGFHSHYYRRG